MFESIGLVPIHRPSRRWDIARIKSQLSTKQLFWITCAVLWAVLPQLYRLPWWFLPMTIVVVSYRFYAQLNHIKKAYNIVLMMIAILTLLLIVYTQGLGLSREISVTILITMTVLKLLETYLMRDALLVVMLCFFVTMTRFLYSQDLLLVFYLLASAFVSTHALAMLNFEKTNKWFDFQQLKSTASSLVLAIPFATLFFLVFPRLGAPIWGSPDIFGEGKTGISDTMSPGSIVELFMDDSPAFRVTFEDGYIPPNNQLYWRGPVLWNFDGRMWSRKKHNNVRQTIRQYQADAAIEYQIELENTGQKYMFGLDYVIAAPEKAFLLPDSLLYSPTAINQLKHYKLKSLLLGRFHQPVSEPDLDLLLAYPSGQNQQTLAMMQNWKAEAKNDLAIINRALNWFNQDEFYYSFTPPPLENEVIDEFLFGTKRGFCEHYASSFVIMMRMAGIPARVVTGYQGGVDNGEYLLVKQSDAHAWAEVYIQHDGVGYWQRVDPTSMVAPERVEQGAREIMAEKRNAFDFEWLKNARESMDKYRYQWNRWVREFNVSKQQALFRAIGIEHRDGKSLALMMIGILFVTALLILIPLWWIKRKRYHSLQKLYLNFAQLAKKYPNLYQQHQQGIEVFASGFIKKFPDTKTQVNHFVNLYLNTRYSDNQELKHKNLSHLYQTLQKIKTKTVE